MKVFSIKNRPIFVIFGEFDIAGDMSLLRGPRRSSCVGPAAVCQMPSPERAPGQSPSTTGSGTKRAMSTKTIYRRPPYSQSAPKSAGNDVQRCGSSRVVQKAGRRVLQQSAGERQPDLAIERLFLGGAHSAVAAAGTATGFESATVSAGARSNLSVNFFVEDSCYECPHLDQAQRR